VGGLGPGGRVGLEKLGLKNRGGGVGWGRGGGGGGGGGVGRRGGRVYTR